MATDTRLPERQSKGATPPVAAAVELLDVLPAAVVVVSRDGVIRYRNALASEWLLDVEDFETALTDVHVLLPFDGWKTELTRIAETGTTRHFAGAVACNGKSSGILATIRCSPFDEAETEGNVIVLICESIGRESVAQRLEISERLTSLGKLATRVAHELSNPLDGILRYVNLALRVADQAPKSKIHSYLSESRTGLMRMIQIIGDLLEYSRSTDGAFDATDINQVVEQSIASHAPDADARGVVVSANFRGRDMPFVTGTRLYQVCCNLIKNAIDAMPDGGRLSVMTAVVNDHVVIEFADTGVGLPETVETVFEPFFTTKKAGEGSGLGLAICRDFIEDMKGTITAERGDEAGAVFTVRIPVSACGHRPALLGTRSSRQSRTDRDVAATTSDR